MTMEYIFYKTLESLKETQNIPKTKYRSLNTAFRKKKKSLSKKAYILNLTTPLGNLMR